LDQHNDTAHAAVADAVAIEHSEVHHLQTVDRPKKLAVAVQCRRHSEATTDSQVAELQASVHSLSQHAHVLARNLDIAVAAVPVALASDTLEAADGQLKTRFETTRSCHCHCHLCCHRHAATTCLDSNELSSFESGDSHSSLSTQRRSKKKTFRNFFFFAEKNRNSTAEKKKKINGRMGNAIQAEREFEEETNNERVDVDGHRRDYICYRPRSAVAKKVSVCLCLHGRGGTGQGLRRTSKFGLDVLSKQCAADTLNDNNNGALPMVLLYPDGLGRQWRCGRRDSDDIDDVKFLQTIASGEAERLGDAFSGRIYCWGHSNGAFMTIRVAQKLPGFLSAIGVVCGGLAAGVHDVGESWSPTPVATLIVVGDQDHLIPIKGGPIGMLRATDDNPSAWQQRKMNKKSSQNGDLVPFEDTLSFFVTLNGLDASSRAETTLAPIDDSDSSRVTRIDYDAPAEAADAQSLVAYRLHGHGHEIPSCPSILPAALVGKCSRNLDTTAVLFDFFARS
jgi:polyhydroxybutyrate depolymerase